MIQNMFKCKCGSNDNFILQKANNNKATKLVCGKCLKYIKFIGNNEISILKSLQNNGNIKIENI